MIRKTKDISMVEGPILLKMLRFSIPIMLTGILQLLFNAADIAVVGRFAENGVVAVGAVGACGALINLIVNSSMGLSLGVGVAVAHDIGSGSRDRMGKVVHTAMVAAMVLGIAVAGIGFFFARPLLQLMDTPDNVLSEAVPYMKAYFLGIPASLMYNYLASALRSSGDTKRPLIFLAVAGLSNVVFNLIMVLGLGMGAIGVGIATAISQYVALALILIYMTRPFGP
ncbi:MAG: polysaccharide biosynthesis C-terminal domain-containing protein, partial [Clostridia bacterium]|nr:polysaccharide biosynthesis C-terminal domain-containing protein [Clostridia bacterium]